MTTTDSEERGGTFLQVDSLEVAVFLRRDQWTSIRLGKLLQVVQTWERCTTRRFFHLTCGGSTTSERALNLVCGRCVQKFVKREIYRAEAVACDWPPDVQGKRFGRGISL